MGQPLHPAAIHRKGNSGLRPFGDPVHDDIPIVLLNVAKAPSRQ